MKHHEPTSRRPFQRLAALILTLTMLVGLLPAYLVPEADAASWMEPYLDKVVEWGVMRGDQDGALNADDPITRAEFVTMVNRAYGYTEAGINPFADVDLDNWYYDDIRIAYDVGYFNGTSATTAAPENSLTREQATIILARNMMLEENTGELLGYTDSRDFSSWSRGLIESATNAGVISGYPDGTFQPQGDITRGEVAKMIVSAVGTPVQSAGSYSLDTVYGNVTITAADVTLRDTTIAGDLYLTGGIGLGDVQLINVTVLGKIVVAGAGESEDGDSSVVLRNVTANQLVIDSISDQFVTLRSEGDTSIEQTNVRTHAYIEDDAPTGYGLKNIIIDGESGIEVHLSGDIKSVSNQSPSSKLVIAQGVADSITIDEKAVGSTLTIENGARAREVNLDVATTVDGKGDIANLYVNASGCTSSILPDAVTVRPGITATIGSQSMDSVTAAEYSAEPRLLAGYPAARNIAPKTATAVFSTNKVGTVYWAVSAVADGSVAEEDLITTPAYSGQIVKSGSVKITASKTEVTANLTGLTSDGSYYLSAVLVDSRGEHSAVKVSAFTTPDDSTPAFATGYPVMSKLESTRAQVTVMPTKSCQLFYALLPKGSTAPKAADFKSGAVTGNLGYGVLDVVKNSTSLFWVNEVSLDELVSYDLYLWLNDYDGVKSSAVQKLSFTTPDGTPPVVTRMDQSDAKVTSIEMTAALNEPGTIYWAVVKAGEDFLRPLSGQTNTPLVTDTAAKQEVENGLGAIKKGTVSVSKADTDVKFTISGLAEQTAYDLYYVAKDKAGNYSEMVEVRENISTLDEQAPTVTIAFTRYNGTESTKPLPDTDIQLIFSEAVQGVDTDEHGNRVYTKFLKLYQDVVAASDATKVAAREALADELRKHITLKEIVDQMAAVVTERTAETPEGSTDWTIDYRYATITMEDGKMVLTLPTNTNNPELSALNLKSGGTYQFRFEGIADVAATPNLMGNFDLEPAFTTVYAQVNMSRSDVSEFVVPSISGDYTVSPDISFRLTPVSTSKVPDSDCYDIILWSDTDVKFNLYRRVVDTEHEATDTENYKGSDWELVGTHVAEIKPNPGEIDGYSYTLNLLDSEDFQPVKTLYEYCNYEFAIYFTEIGGQTNRDGWDAEITNKVTIAAANKANLKLLTNRSITPDYWSSGTSTFTSIGLTYNGGVSSDELVLKTKFTDKLAPKFDGTTYPLFTTDSTSATVTVLLDRPATIFYVATPLKNGVPQVNTEIADGTKITGAVNGSGGNDHDWNLYRDTYVPVSGGDQKSSDRANPIPVLTRPTTYDIKHARNDGTNVSGSVSYTDSSSVLSFDITGLTPETDYYVFFVLQGESAESSYPEVYKFTTTSIKTPAITLTNLSPKAQIDTDTDASVTYALIATTKLPTVLTQRFWPNSTLADEYKTLTDTNATVVPSTSASVITDTGMTVIQAIEQEKDHTKHLSYFDLYATPALKEKVLEYITATVVNGDARTTQATTTVSPSNSATVDLTKNMSYDTDYYLVAVGKHPELKADAIHDGDTMANHYGYKAVAIKWIDTTAPQMTNTSPVALSSFTNPMPKLIPGATEPTGGYQSEPTLYLYSGTITLTFDKALWYNDNGTLKKVVMKVTDPSTQISALELVDGSFLTGKPDAATLAENPYTPYVVLDTSKMSSSDLATSQTFAFKVYYASIADEFIFPKNNKVVGSSSGDAAAVTTLRFDPTLKSSNYKGSYSDTLMPGFIIASQTSN